MTIWLLALSILTAIACATLYYAGAARTVNAGATASDALTSHFRAQLKAIDTDAAAGRLGVAEATAAKGELAREVMRLKDETVDAPVSGGRLLVLVPVVLVPVALVAVLAIGTYAYLGRPDLPAEPLAQRTDQSAAGLDVDDAIKTIEMRLATDPSDVRGWQVLAPAYMQMGRYADAVNALRKVNALAPPTADSWTNLGEALMMQNGGSVAGEPLELFKKAAAMDPTHVRSRYYIAGEETRTGDYGAAIADWNSLLSLSKGDEPWVVTAKNGLAFAETGLNPGAAASSEAPAAATQMPDSTQIDAMVDGLDARLKASGGSIEEWTQLVRSRLVQGKTAEAQAAYEAARKAYPDAKVRTELDVLAADSGLSRGGGAVMTRKQKRLSVIGGLGAVVIVAFGLILFALRDQIVFFYSPTEIHEKAVAVGTSIRLGGLVKDGTWKKDGQQNDFVVTDGTTDMTARYNGILPDLFREGQGVVVEGAMAIDGTFAATNVLAKHDEKYMPREVVEELKARGEWQPDGTGG